MTETTFPAEKNIVITGFMGTGKTTVGRLLAERLHRTFVDMDIQIEAQFYLELCFRPQPKPHPSE